MKIHKPYGEKPPRRCNCCGNRMETQYAERYDENGHPYLVKTGEVDTYKIIQSHKEECDIRNILMRYSEGDTSVVHEGQYIDTTNIPTNVHEMFNFMNSQKEKFDALPTAIKQKFDNSFEVWASAAGTNEWLEKMGMNEKKPETEAKNNGEQE